MPMLHKLAILYSPLEQIMLNPFYKSLYYTLTYEVCHEVLGILQRIIKTETFGDHTAVLWNVLFVFLVAAGTITTRFYIPLF